ncbi:MAG: hypothetical protein HZA04_02720 [Nitrospinae bacterium]|nr:hypothetical protein [Nitrospinota bacterium]
MMGVFEKVLSAICGGYWASSQHQIFHKPSCGQAQKISQANKIVFQSEGEARGAGFRPCYLCLSRRWPFWARRR